MASCSALTLFVLLLGIIVYVPVVSHWDLLATAFVQGWRSDSIDPIMLAITLLGDVLVALSVAMAILICFLSQKRWWLSIHLLSVCLSAYWAVMIVKSYTQRVRPAGLIPGLDSFSFPSGHACTAAVMTGVAALVIAYGRRSAVRRTIYTLAALLTMLIGVSRIYLHVHWPTDVLAGWCLGFALVIAFAWQLHSSNMSSSRAITPLIVCVAMLTVLAHLSMNWTARASTYGLIVN